MNATLFPTPALERAPSRVLQHQGDLDKFTRIRESHNADLARWGLSLANALVSQPEITRSPEVEAMLGLIRIELEAERRELLDAGLLPWAAGR